MKYYNLRECNRLFIYGLNERGKKLYVVLENEGFKNVIFIDKYYKEEEHGNYKILTPEEYLNNHSRNTDCLLVVLNDGSKHDQIAEQFFTKGLRRIVFLPMNCFDLVQRHLFRVAYQEIVENNQLDFKLPECPVEKMDSWSTGIINRYYSNHTSIWCNISEIYIDSPDEKALQELIEKSPLVYAERKKYFNCKAIDVDAYVQLFDELKKDEPQVESLDLYMKLKGLYKDEEKRQLLKNRKDLYNQFEKALMYDPYFFVDSPIRCEYKDNKIYLEDGLHRFFFLISQGYNFVPIILSNEQLFNYLTYKGKNV